MSTRVQGCREYRVGRASDVPECGGVLIEADGVELGLFKVRGRLHAYENRCRHQGGPVCTGEVIGRWEAVLRSDGTIAGEGFVDDEVRVACPWHGWEYDLENGECTADRRFRLRSFPIRVRDGDVYVRV